MLCCLSHAVHALIHGTAPVIHNCTSANISPKYSNCLTVFFLRQFFLRESKTMQTPLVLRGYCIVFCFCEKCNAEFVNNNSEAGSYRKAVLTKSLISNQSKEKTMQIPPLVLKILHSLIQICSSYLPSRICIFYFPSQKLVKNSLSSFGAPYLSFASAMALIMKLMLRARFLIV